MPNHKAPSAGQKVTAGQDAPVYQEGAGVVDNTSLAAESFRSGGTFSENRGADRRAAGTARSDSGSAIPENQEAYGGPPPSYVTSQYRRDPKGPHGKNLHEGGFEGEGPGNSINAEPGSLQDPARRAELDMKLSQNKAGRHAGPRQAGPDEHQPYSALNDDESA